MNTVTKTKTKIRKKRRISLFIAWRRRVLGRRLGDILLHSNLITEAQLSVALEEHSRTRKPLGTVLVLQRSISPNTLIRTLRKQFYQKITVVMLILFGALMSF